MTANAVYRRPGLVAWPVVCGINFGAQMPVLCYSDRAALVYVPGHSHYAGRMSPTGYAPTKAVIVQNNDRRANYRVLSEGGRWDVERLKRHADVIDRQFGEGTADALEWGATFVLGGDPWFHIMGEAP